MVLRFFCINFYLFSEVYNKPKGILMFTSHVHMVLRSGGKVPAHKLWRYSVCWLQENRSDGHLCRNSSSASEHKAEVKTRR